MYRQSDDRRCTLSGVIATACAHRQARLVQFSDLIGHAAVTTLKSISLPSDWAGRYGQAGVRSRLSTSDRRLADGTASPQDSRRPGSFDADGQSNGLLLAYRLQLVTPRPLALQETVVFRSSRSAGQGSYYYSQPFYQVTGSVELDGQPIKVSGRAWLDREWSLPAACRRSDRMGTGSRFIWHRAIMSCTFRLRDSKGGTRLPTGYPPMARRRRFRPMTSFPNRCGTPM